MQIQINSYNEQNKIILNEIKKFINKEYLLS